MGHRRIFPKSCASVMAQRRHAPRINFSNLRRATRARPSQRRDERGARDARPLSSPLVNCFRPWSAQSRHTMPSEETASRPKDARSRASPAIAGIGNSWSRCAGLSTQSSSIRRRSRRLVMVLSNVPTSRHHGAPKYGDALLASRIRCRR